MIEVVEEYMVAGNDEPRLEILIATVAAMFEKVARGGVVFESVNRN